MRAKFEGLTIPGVFSRPQISLRFAVSTFVLSLSLNSVLRAEAPTPAKDGSSFLVVDCLLPGQIRRLGANATYPTPRRPVKTSISDCEIRGGEYVAYDRGNYKTALQYWLPLAEQGDKQAQTYLGEIYERGLTGTRDYAAAVQWYKKAADQGFSRALINLGSLYEQGLGVEKDQVLALNLYRQAAGLGNLIALDSEDAHTSPKAEERIQALNKELAETRRQLEEARKSSKKATADKSSELDALKLQLQKAVDEGRLESVKRLEAQVQQREAQLEKQGQALSRLERLVETYKNQLQKLQSADAASSSASSTAKPGSDGNKETAALAPPTIHLIDPPMVAVRSPLEYVVRGAPSNHDVIGRVVAPAGLASLTVNGKAQNTDKNGMFKTQVSLGKTGTIVSLAALDKQGKRVAMEFAIVPEEFRKKVAKSKTKVLNPGTYHAIVIGVSDYPKLEKLDTSINDAKAVSDILGKRYKFKVTTLINPTRYQILSELNTARSKLTEDDNLLIYYAGHGEYDETNSRAHWLPLDAEPHSDANWISSIAVTDILNAMLAKHVIVVADSCYAGAMTRASIGQIEVGTTDEARAKLLSAIAKARSRTVLTSGGVAPVLDGGGGKHSIFAKTFLDILTQNDDVLEGQRLFRELSSRVIDLARRLANFDQQPEYAPMRFAGHESGDFLFLPAN